MNAQPAWNTSLVRGKRRGEKLTAAMVVSSIFDRARWLSLNSLCHSVCRQSNNAALKKFEERRRNF